MSIETYSEPYTSAERAAAAATLLISKGNLPTAGQWLCEQGVVPQECLHRAYRRRSPGFSG
jgi:hypothetical protein